MSATARKARFLGLSRAASAFAMSPRRVAHRLDVVAVGIEDERAVVVRMIMRADPWRAVVPAACRERRAIERINRRAVLGDNGHVHRLVEFACPGDPEIRL